MVQNSYSWNIWMETGTWNRIWSRCRIVLLVALLFPMVGCRGCIFLNDPADAKKKDDKNKISDEDKQRLVVKPMKVVPSSQDLALNYIKPGHWFQARQEAKANQNEESLALTLTVTDRTQKKLPVTGTDSALEFMRDVTLAKGQSKSSDLLFFVPEVPAVADDIMGVTPKPSILATYSQRRSGIPIFEQSNPGIILQTQEYLLAVLSKEPSRHTFWNGLSCMSWPTTERTEPLSMHRMIDVKETEMADWLPDRMMTWTSISHLVWYDINSELFSESQKQALLDWLHFGGTIILSGPDCLAGVNQSMIAPYLPMKQLGNGKLGADLEAKLLDHWTASRLGEPATSLRLPENRVLPFLQGELTDGSQWINDAEGLVAERLVGRGRIVMTMFPLSDDVFVKWPSYGSFVNATLLRKPGRQWMNTEFGGDFEWAGPWKGQETSPRLSTRFRLLARDTTTALHTPSPRVNIDPKTDLAPRKRQNTYEIHVDPIVTNNQTRARSLGAWSDTSGPAVSVAQSLRAASGIVVPRIGMIMQLLAGYLLVLVPLNWILFRLLGRLEWAWVAAPVIALVGAVIVARSVQLDVGFSRSENRGGILELHAGYPRGHYSSFTALYTSLTTSYQATFPEDQGFVLPFGALSVSAKRTDSQSLRYNFAQESGTGLASFTVLSNTTGMLHTEQMLEVGKGIQCRSLDSQPHAFEVVNSSGIDLNGFSVCGFDETGKWRQAWIGRCENNRKYEVVLEPNDAKARWFEQWDRDEISRKQEFVTLPDGHQQLELSQSGIFSVAPLLENILQSHEFERGEFIGIGWLDSSLGSFSIQPAAAQRIDRNVVIVHFGNRHLDRAFRDGALPTATILDADEEVVDPAKSNATNE